MQLISIPMTLRCFRCKYIFAFLPTKLVLQQDFLASVDSICMWATDFSSFLLPLLFFLVFCLFVFWQLCWSSGQTRARGYFCCIRRLRKPDLAAAEDTSGGGGGGSQLGGTPLTIFAQKSVDPLFKLQIFVSFHKEKTSKRKVCLKNKTDSVKV